MNYGTFPYGEQFYTVGPIVGDCETIYEFVASDVNETNCSSSFVFNEPICCVDECSISNLEIVSYNCIDQLNISSFTLNFEVQNGESSMFQAFLDGLSLGIFAYADLPVLIEFETGNDFILEVRDSENNNCRFIEEFELDCNGFGCSITEVEATFIECNEDKDAYFVSLNFAHENTSASFNLITDGELYGSFAFNELPLTIGPLAIDSTYIFSIIDGEFGDCANEFEFFLEQCETSLEDLSFENVEIFQGYSNVQIINNESENLNLRLYSTNGSLISTLNVNAQSSKTIDTSSMSKGLYLLNISTKTAQKTIKLIVN
jgi:hypothetical protein